MRFLSRYRAAIRTCLLGTAAMLGLSGDFIGTFDASGWLQRLWMIVMGGLILAAFVAVEVLTTREDRRVARELEAAQDELRQVVAEERRLRSTVQALRSESELYREELAASVKDASGLAWLVSSEGRAALDGLREFSDRVVSAHGSDEARARAVPAAGSAELLAAEVPTWRGTLATVGAQVVAGLVVAAAFAALILGIEVYLD